MAKNSRLVYSTDAGRIDPDADKGPKLPETDGIVRIKLERKGRGGKDVSVVTGVPVTSVDELKKLGKKLKQSCGTGGSVKNGQIEIQGNHRDALKTTLEKHGYTVKLAGG